MAAPVLRSAGEVKYGNMHSVESEERNKGPCRNADEDDAHHGSRLKQSAGEGNKSREGPRAKEYPL